MAKQTRRMTREMRSDYYRAIYLGLGAERSTKAVWEFCAAHMQGPIPSYPTLRRYATDFEWVASAAEFDQRQGGGDAETRKAWQRAFEMDGRQAMLGIAMQSVAGQALGVVKPKDVGASGIASLADKGVKIERLAVGAVTERVEITVDSLNAIMNGAMIELQNVLAQIETIDAADRTWAASLFASLLDDVAYRFLATRGIEPPPVASEVPLALESGEPTA